MGRTVISKTFSTKNQIKGGKVYISWRGDNVDLIEEKLLKALESVQASKKDITWIDNSEYLKKDLEEAEYKRKTKRTSSLFSLKIG